ncbi:MAG: hypothetical protein Q9225_003910 [Loekoesia sp. 1 TL-2023]
MSDYTTPTKIPLTPRDTQLAVIALQCLQESGNIKIDWEKFTQMAEFKNKNSANSSFGALKHKLSQATLDNYYVAHASAAATVSGTPKKRKTPTTKKSKALAAAEYSDNDGAEAVTPKKRVAEKEESKGQILKRIKLSPEAEAKVDAQE